MTVPFVVPRGGSRLAGALIDIKAAAPDGQVDPGELDRIGQRHGARTSGPPLEPRPEG